MDRYVDHSVFGVCERLTFWTDKKGTTCHVLFSTHYSLLILQVVVVSSISGKLGTPIGAAYSASKFALVSVKYSIVYCMTYDACIMWSEYYPFSTLVHSIQSDTRTVWCCLYGKLTTLCINVL